MHSHTVRPQQILKNVLMELAGQKDYTDRNTINYNSWLQICTKCTLVLMSQNTEIVLQNTYLKWFSQLLICTPRKILYMKRWMLFACAYIQKLPSLKRSLFYLYFVIFCSSYSWCWWWVQFSAKWINETLKVLCKSNWSLGFLSERHINDCKIGGVHLLCCTLHVCSTTSFVQILDTMCVLQRRCVFHSFIHHSFFKVNLTY